MRNRALAKRLAALEAGLTPPPPLRWAPWQVILTAEEQDLVDALASRGAQPRGERGGDFADDPEGWAVLCADDRERALLTRVLAKATDPAFPPPWERTHWPLYLYLLDLQL